MTIKRVNVEGDKPIYNTIKKRILRNIIFIGGIHGSGKGKICEEIRRNTALIHVTASEVLKWNELSFREEKVVANIDDTQDRLITNLNLLIDYDKRYLLDGHYCLLNKDGTPTKIPIKTFRDIDPAKLILVTAEPEIIKRRLEERDSKIYDEKLLREFQDLEIAYSNELSRKLQIPFVIVDSLTIDLDNLLDFIK